MSAAQTEAPSPGLHGARPGPARVPQGAGAPSGGSQAPQGLRPASVPEAGLESRDPRTVTVFEIVGSYFVDVFFNSIYLNVRSALRPGEGLREKYVVTLHAYMTGIRVPDCYNTLVNALRDHYIATTRHSLSHAEFIDRVVEVCVPADLNVEVDASGRDLVLSELLAGLLGKLTAFAVQPAMLRAIVEDHDRDPKTTIQCLQDGALQILFDQRDAIYARFLAPLKQLDSRPALVDEMKGALQRLAREKQEANARALAAEARCEALRKRLASAQESLAAAQVLVSKQEEEKAQLHRRAAAYLRYIGDHRLAAAGAGPSDSKQGPLQGGNSAPARQGAAGHSAPAPAPESSQSGLGPSPVHAFGRPSELAGPPAVGSAAEPGGHPLSGSYRKPGFGTPEHRTTEPSESLGKRLEPTDESFGLTPTESGADSNQTPLALSQLMAGGFHAHDTA